MELPTVWGKLMEKKEEENCSDKERMIVDLL